MQKIINRYADATFQDRFSNHYRVWKFGKPKHNYYVKNRRAKELTLDYYDQYIIEHAEPGSVITYDSAGYYLDGVFEDLTVIELNPIVLKWYPQAIIDTGEDSVRHLYHKADNFIVNNTIKLRWKTFDDYTNYWITQQRFLKPGAQIFWSFRDIFIFHNRLKYRLSELLVQWLQSMESHGFELIKLTHDLIPITPHLTHLPSIPEITDMANGNIKVHWRYQPCK